MWQEFEANLDSGLWIAIHKPQMHDLSPLGHSKSTDLYICQVAAPFLAELW